MSLDLPTRTTTRLLEDLRDAGNAAAWEGFDGRYRPILSGFGRKLGLSSEDARELAQQTLTEFYRAYSAGRYERSRGRLRTWLIGIARNLALSMRRRRGAEPLGDDRLLESVPDEGQLTRVWEQEREQAIFAEALTRLRSSTRTEPATLRAFELYVIQGAPAAEVASLCDLSVDSVYVAKNRLTRWLREMVDELRKLYDDGE